MIFFIYFLSLSMRKERKKRKEKIDKLNIPFAKEEENTRIVIIAWIERNGHDSSRNRGIVSTSVDYNSSRSCPK